MERIDCTVTPANDRQHTANYSKLEKFRVCVCSFAAIERVDLVICVRQNNDKGAVKEQRGTRALQYANPNQPNPEVLQN